MDDHISNFGNSSEEFGITPARVVFQVIENQLCKCFMLFKAESYMKEMLNRVEVGLELFDEIELFLQQPVVIDDLPWCRHVCYPHA